MTPNDLKAYLSHLLGKNLQISTMIWGWYVWAAGNRKEDRAAVFDMPTPLANRFLHLQVEPDFDSFKAYALEIGVHEQVIAFLSFRSTLLHKPDPQQPAWPSPRSWVMASSLHHAGLDIAPAVGASFSRLLVLFHPLAPSSYLAKDFRSSWLERYAIAQNPNTPTHTLKLLAVDGNRLVRAVAKANLQCKLK